MRICCLATDVGSVEEKVSPTKSELLVRRLSGRPTAFFVCSRFTLSLLTLHLFLLRYFVPKGLLKNTPPR